MTDAAVELLKAHHSEVELALAQDTVNRVLNLNIAGIADHTAVMFEKRFSGSISYTYLALKVITDGKTRWYITVMKEVMTDEEFEQFLASRLGFERFMTIMTIEPDKESR